MWKKNVIELGVVKSKSKQIVKFQYEGQININKITVSCGCTEASFDNATNTLIVVYTPTTIPYHLKEAGQTSYLSTKRIVVDSDNSSDILTFTATVED